MKLFAILLIFLLECHCKLHSYNWVVAKTPLNPDGFMIKEQATINGQMPGPEIRVPYASNIKINVTNNLNHDLTIHWHGLAQKNSLKADGVPHVTQDPIPPGGNYIYQFSTGDQSGTFWYHAHTGLDGANVFGAFVINDARKRHAYDEERLLVLSEYWHKDLDQSLIDLMRVPYVSIGNPDSILINGRTSYNSTNNQFTKINVKPNRKYRFRLVGAQDHSFYRFKIQNHKLTVIEADGTLVDPFTVDHLDINSGTRYSVILETSNNLVDSLISCQIINEGNKVKNGLAILHYDGASNSLESVLSTLPDNQATNDDATFEEKLITSKSKYSENYYPVPTSYDQELIFNSAWAKVDDLPIYKINDVIFKPRTTNLLPKFESQPDLQEEGVYKITANGKGKQFILQHFTVPGRECQQHPWHLHGHTFYVVGKGSGVYQPKRDQIKVNPNRPPILRDTFTFIPQVKRTPQTKNDDPNSCGWYAIRFNADNPGLWMMHCHIAAHMIMGKQVVIHAQTDDTIRYFTNKPDQLSSHTSSRPSRKK